MGSQKNDKANDKVKKDKKAGRKKKSSKDEKVKKDKKAKKKKKAEKKAEKTGEKTGESKKSKKSRKRDAEGKDTKAAKVSRASAKKRNGAPLITAALSVANGGGPRPKLRGKDYEAQLAQFQTELVRMQKWIQSEGLKVALIFEGRDAAGKGGAIKRITQSLNPRVCRVVALPKPTERERTQWYFQRYVKHLPAAGEMVLFDRSWYNRAGVERVMGFCSDEEYDQFMRSCPQFERMIVASGIKLIKYWFSVSDEEQERRFRKRINDPVRRWKISEMDLLSRSHWVDYSKAKDEMFRNTDIGQCRWYVVDGDDKKRARLNVIAHLLSQIPYTEVPVPKLKLPDRQENDGYQRPPMEEQTFVPELF